MIGKLVRINRQYEVRRGSVDLLGVILEYRQIVEQNPLNKTAKIKLLLSSGVLWDFFLYKEDGFEVVE